MLSQLRIKIRAILQDSSKTGIETFTASGNTFNIAQANTSEVTAITVNGTAISQSGNWSYDDQLVTFESGIISSGDVIVISYIYTKYSDTELNDYIRTALIYMDTYSYSIHFDISSGDIEIYPIPLAKEQNLIAMIVSILIRPDWSQYRTASVTIIYPRTVEKDVKIEKVISKFKRSKIGIVGVIDLEGDY